MKNTSQAKDCLGSSDVERFEKVIADIHNADNKLLEEFTHLSECYNMLRAAGEQAQRRERTAQDRIGEYGPLAGSCQQG